MGPVRSESQQIVSTTKPASFPFRSYQDTKTSPFHPLDQPHQLKPKVCVYGTSKMASIVSQLRSGAPQKPTDKTRKIQVIGSGMGRTGTMSLSAALERLLDGKVYHCGTMIFQDEEGFFASSFLSSLPHLPFPAHPEEIHINTPNSNNAQMGPSHEPRHQPGTQQANSKRNASRICRDHRYMGSLHDSRTT